MGILRTSLTCRTHPEIRLLGGKVGIEGMVKMPAGVDLVDEVAIMHVSCSGCRGFWFGRSIVQVRHKPLRGIAGLSQQKLHYSPVIASSSCVKERLSRG
jgi:hypothetical protein